MSDATSRHEVQVGASAETALLVFATVGEGGGVGVEGAVARAGCGLRVRRGAQSRDVAERLEAASGGAIEGEEPLRCLGGSRRWCGLGVAVAARVKCRSW